MQLHARAGLGRALIVPIVLVVVACSGGTASSAPAATDTPAPGSSSAAPATGAASASLPAGAFPSFDLSALSKSIPGLDSYRVSMTTKGTKDYESVVVTQPVLSKAITTYEDDGVTVDSRFVIVGPDTWTADGADGPFTAVPSGLASTMLLMFDPATLMGVYAAIPWRQSATDVGTETKNGVSAHHLKIDPTTLGGALSSVPAGSSIDAWVADAGYLVALEVAGTDSDFQIEVSNVNDPSNQVQKPS